MQENVDFRWIAADTGFPLSTIYFFNRTGKGPRAFKLGRRYLVARADYDEWLNAVQEPK
jgi:predicted DNA-binding transcriptional regulator AlpA